MFLSCILDAAAFHLLAVGTDNINFKLTRMKYRRSWCSCIHAIAYTPPPTHTQEINNSHAFPCSFMIAEKG